jgi:hypothetical protein
MPTFLSSRRGATRALRQPTWRRRPCEAAARQLGAGEFDVGASALAARSLRAGTRPPTGEPHPAAEHYALELERAGDDVDAIERVLEQARAELDAILRRPIANLHADSLVERSAEVVVRAEGWSVPDVDRRGRSARPNTRRRASSSERGTRWHVERRPMSEYRASGEQDVSGWASGGITFAATVLAIVGTFQILDGLVAILNDDFYLRTANYTFNLDVSAWGWIHLLLGILFVAAAWGLYSGSTWAGVTAIVVASLSAIANFLFIPYYPLWSILVIALNVWVIWALTRPGALRRA